MNKLVRVAAEFRQSKGVLFGTNTSDCRIDDARLERDIQLALVSLNDEGYEVVQLMPVTSGNYLGAGSQGGGWSFTEAVLIVARKFDRPGKT